MTANAHGIEARRSCAAAANQLSWDRCIVRLAIFGYVPFEEVRRAVNHLAAPELTSADLFGHAADEMTSGAPVTSLCPCCAPRRILER